MHIFNSSLYFINFSPWRKVDSVDHTLPEQSGAGEVPAVSDDAVGDGGAQGQP